MTKRYENMEIASETVEPFVLCLALGTIEAIKYKMWNSEAGIWTIRRPVFFKKLKTFGIPQNIIDTLEVFDELSAIETLSGKTALISEIEKIEEIIRTRLKDFEETFWFSKWSEL